MKIEQLLVQHLYDSRRVTLQGIGNFTLSDDLVFPDDKDKDIVIPPSAISFTYDPKAVEDDNLINYIVQQTRKIKPLASADFDSYVVLGKQFLNIGKPFRIEGVGTLIKNQQGEYEFTPGIFITPKIEAAPALLKEKTEFDEISFGKEITTSNRKKWLWIATGLLVLGAAGFGGWYLLNKKKGNKPGNDETATRQPAVNLEKQNDTLTKKTDSLNIQQLPKNDTYTFKIVFKVTTNKAEAERELAKYTARKHTVIMYTADSITYKIAEPFTLPLSDTLRVKDSLNTYYFSGKARVEL